MTSEITIGTHGGTFHADEVLACVMLKLLPQFENAEIIRTRDQEKLSKLDVLVDVGEVFDHENKRYDHHQKTFNQTMSSISEHQYNYDTKLSSAGLVYFFYGKQMIRHILSLEEVKDEEQIEYVFCQLYEAWIQGEHRSLTLIVLDFS